MLLSGEAGYRQISTDGGAAGTPRHRATHALALFLLAAAHRQRALSDHQPDGACRWICARRHAASEARQARCAAGAELNLSQDAALFAEMLSLPNDGRYPALELTPQQRRQRTLEALTAQIEALSRSNPVLMIFEDVHWIDPTSLEVLRSQRWTGCKTFACC